MSLLTRSLCRITVLLAMSIAAFAQSDRGTLTGTVADSSGSLVPNADVTAINPANGQELKVKTTETGNFTIPSVSAGTYSLVVEVAGFRRYEQQGIRVQVAQTARVDVVMQVGNAAESVTVTADAQLLTTENAALSTTVGREQLNQLPLNFAIGAGAVRNPLSFVQLAPGASISGWNTIRVNGAPAGTFKIIFEGQDSSSGLDARVSDESQPSVEALEEFTLQTSNFSAEFGQAGGGLFNFTARSGTNQFHGTLYDYIAHEKLYAGRPFTNNGSGGHIRPQLRRHDLGANLGGPIILPKLYNGRNKSFFFVNYEMFRDVSTNFIGLGTVPTEAMRRGDFSAVLTGRRIGTDPLGNAVFENVIYDPRTTRQQGGFPVRDPFPDNVIPQSLLDPVALKIQSLIPAPINGNLVNNFERRSPYRKIQDIPSIKIDHNLSDKAKFSAYYSLMRTDKDNGQDGLPDPISARRDQIIRSNTLRINYDHTLTPTLILHAGVGYQRYWNPDSSPQSILAYDPVAGLGLKGGFGVGFPRFTGLGSSSGGMGLNFGPTNRTTYIQDKPNAVGNMTWVRGNHTYKFGGEWKFENFTNRGTANVSGSYAFSTVQTGLPALQGIALTGGSVGFPYASFLLGSADSASVNNPADPQYRRKAYAAFAQDTWKVTRRLTLDYGLRYDYQPPMYELHNRMARFAPAVANPSAGGRLGATEFAGSGDRRCNCTFGEAYPWAFGPRLGAAYQINDKTVLRGGFGVSFGQIANFQYIGGGNSLGMGFNSLGFSNPTFGEAAVLLRNGLVYNQSDLLSATYDPGIRPQPGQTNSPPAYVDPDAGRPSRMISWNVSLQRELSRDLALEAAYVGNRGAWFRADGLNQFNGITNDRLSSFGLSLNNPADVALLPQQIASAAVVARGFTKPYAAFPNTATLAQSLRPYPQFGDVSSLWAPLGNSWYDSLQVKLTKRYSYGLDFTAAYTFSKTLSTVEAHDGTIVPLNDVYNRGNQKTLSNSDQPHVFVTGFNYKVPSLGSNRALKALSGGWTFGGILRYASGLPIRVPTAQSTIGSLVFRGGTNANRVADQPFFLKDPNCGCFDPNKEFILNPNAWANPVNGQWGTAAAYYADYRTARRPDEQLSVGRNFKLTERMMFSVRAEFFNVFNRVYLNNPDSGNFQATTQVGANGQTISGFGRINTGTTFSPPRSGQIVARFSF
ncbi:MAG: TonB-dependent receptor [Bryobacteraceae bacterium]|nr:TonB-dependent receptor [Bryobacteraceae bacterium]